MILIHFQVSSLDKETILLDICCGTGLYSVALSPFVKQVIGVEVDAEAVADARHNVRLNSMDNVEFIRGLAETEIPKILDSLGSTDSKIVAIINPSRFGLGSKLIMALRSFKRMKKLVYVSCNPFGKSAYNFFNLCRPPNLEYRNIPFRIVRTVPVDLFPQTAHCELVLLFER